MGIRGLTGWIRWAAPSSIGTPDWGAYEGQRIGIDILSSLYKVKAQGASPFLYFAQLLAACKKLRIIPVILFDGKPPESKRTTLASRSATRVAAQKTISALTTDLIQIPMSPTQRTVVEEQVRAISTRSSSTYITSEERDICKQICYAAGIMCLNADGEADDVLAHFSKTGDFSAVISGDLDLLARGVENLLVPDTWALPGESDGWRYYTLSTILDSTQLTYDMFVEMCVLMGCDYTAGLPSLPYKSAYWATKYRRDFLRTLEVMRVADDRPYISAVAMLRNAAAQMGEKQWQKWRSGPPFVEPQSLAAFRCGPLADLPAADYDALLIGDGERLTIE